MTALTGMNVPAAETSPDDSAVSVEEISFPADTVSPVGLTTVSETVSLPQDKSDFGTPPMEIPVSATPNFW